MVYRAKQQNENKIKNVTKQLQIFSFEIVENEN
jgi:hypothetical protein